MSIEYSLGESLVMVEGISLTLGGHLILRNVNATVHDIMRPGLTQGQIVALLGPSGVGKTQLFRILAGLNRPDTGQVLVNEQSPHGNAMVPVVAGVVGVVPQHYTLFSHRTVMDNLLIAGKMAGMTPKAAREKAAGLLDRFVLSDKEERYPAELSGGQRQRIAIAQQLMCSGELLLMDEPFSGLDPVMKDETCELINEVAAMDTRMTIVVVTHDISAALQVADTLWLMGRDREADGKIVPGAYIKETVDLIERGLAWAPNIRATPVFADVSREVYEKFLHL